MRFELGTPEAACPSVHVTKSVENWLTNRDPGVKLAMHEMKPPFPSGTWSGVVKNAEVSTGLNVMPSEEVHTMLETTGPMASE